MNPLVSVLPAVNVLDYDSVRSVDFIIRDFRVIGGMNPLGLFPLMVKTY
jgi:hypothetical protein